MRSPRREPSSAAQSATSLPVAPADDAGVRVRNYLLTMGIRITCLLLMALITPYGWYTFVFAVGAIFLPYIAVVGANAASGRNVPVAERPVAAALDAAPVEEKTEAAPAEPTVIRIAETTARPAAETPERPTADPAARPTFAPDDEDRT
ncbi:DUF3099 domain-containing protein [Microbacterium paludicola]|uniref:DUF3099 domain-containing protein n=1 Tax=Microbacterium paludicola TaxID=300019 RepID=A0A4Y9FWK8_9MICO|nr:DUF3099 domain-containing protein [Microbacterium paludicola]MBF0815624.1 DUF3099 domain-containing protein [Microbacterium paludicola]TFU33679.1 DUF3099 domain-containing protein [Microbacterium paludicola]